ncbi:MAG: DUF3298 and DUF4163 domain-containing protein [Cellulosilyticaceae bacterium]
MVKRILFTLLIVPMIFSTICYGQEKENESAGSAIFVMAIPREIEITDEPMKIETKDMMTNIHVPHINGLSDKKREKKINKYFENRIAAIQNNIEKMSKQDQKANDNMRYEVISNYKVKKSRSNYLTVSMFDYIYTGGAHGISNQSYIVIDISENKILTLNELFDEKVDYKQNIKSLIQQQLDEREQQNQPFFDDLLYGFDIKEDERFYIKSNGDLVIVLNVYEVSPYASGMIEFTLPKEQLQGYIHNL